MTSERWLSVPVRQVAIKDLVFGQEHLTVHGLLGHADGELLPVGGDRYPHVVLFGGRHHLADGHHRVTIEAVRGQQLVEARVLER